MTERENGGALARFKAYKPHPDEVYGLAPTHPAVVEGRTLFPNRITSTAESPRFLVSGESNDKIGKVVKKGEWTGFPVFTLTLQERATCPRSCTHWLDCYGNGMQWPNRWDVRDPLFMDTLRAEVITTCRANPKGLVIRLHVLGDFYSLPYLFMWGEMIDRFPQLHLYGYTARREDADDEESRSIAAGIGRLVAAAWDQVAIRFSHTEPGPGRAIVVDEPVVGDPDVIMCPQQTDKTATCGTCALCWAPGARDKTIAFIRHGPHSRGRPRSEPVAPRQTRALRPSRDPGTLADGLPVEKRPRGRPPGAARNFAFGNYKGTADECLTTTPEERLAAVGDDLKAQIAARYGATFKPKEKSDDPASSDA